MATHIKFTDYHTGKVKYRKLNEKAAGRSITYREENGRFVIRTYHDNKVVQRMTAPFGSYTFQAVDKEED